MGLAISDEYYRKHRQWVEELERSQQGQRHPAAETHARWRAYVDAHPRPWEEWPDDGTDQPPTGVARVTER
jgi:hypothetical protein